MGAVRVNRKAASGGDQLERMVLLASQVAVSGRHYHVPFFGQASNGRWCAPACEQRLSPPRNDIVAAGSGRRVTQLAGVRPAVLLGREKCNSEFSIDIPLQR